MATRGCARPKSLCHNVTMMAPTARSHCQLTLPAPTASSHCEPHTDLRANPRPIGAEMLAVGLSMGAHTVRLGSWAQYGGSHCEPWQWGSVWELAL